MKKRILALALLAACAAEQPQQQPARAVERPAVLVKPAPVITDRQLYTMQPGRFGPETTIVSTYTAPPDRDVYLLNCNGQFAVGLQRPAGEKWEHVWAPGMNACMSAPIVIRAGQPYQSTLTVIPGVDAKIDTGTYRVIWHGLYGSYDPNASPPGTDLPVEERVSAPIRIVAP